MQVHFLKTESFWFTQAYYGHKNVEIRFNDRNFKPRDIVVLISSSSTPNEAKVIVRRIDFVYSPEIVPGLKDGYVLLTFRLPTPSEKIYYEREAFKIISARHSETEGAGIG